MEASAKVAFLLAVSSQRPLGATTRRLGARMRRIVEGVNSRFDTLHYQTGIPELQGTQDTVRVVAGRRARGHTVGADVSVRPVGPGGQMIADS